MNYIKWKKINNNITCINKETSLTVFFLDLVYPLYIGIQTVNKTHFIICILFINVSRYNF